jgi:uncharacterized protein (TIGR02001 family)
LAILKLYQEMKNLTKKLLLATGLLSILSSVSFAAEEVTSPVSANITIASDYVWRGKTQSSDKKAVQGGLDNGFSIGVWGSNADWANNMSAEFDIYGSYSDELNSSIGYELGYISYTYNTKDNNFKEAYITGSYDDFGLTYYKGIGDAANYVEGSYSTSVSDIDMSLTIGQYSNASTSGDTSGYKMYGFSFGTSYAGLDYALAFTKVNDNTTGADMDPKNTVFSVSKSF